MKIEFGFTGMVFLLFLTLKLCSVIDWSWWWVTCPLWITPLLVITLGGVVLFLQIIKDAVNG